MNLDARGIEAATNAFRADDHIHFRLTRRDVDDLRRAIAAYLAEAVRLRPMSEPLWPEPRPIAEAMPEMGRILAWDGVTWQPCVWFDDGKVWWPYHCDTYGLAKRAARLLTRFLSMPPAPKVTP